MSATFLGNVFDAFDGDDAFALIHPEHRNTFGVATLQADVGGARADDLAAVADQHDVVTLFDRKGRHQRLVLAADRDGAHALAAASIDAEAVRAAALAEAGVRDEQ